MARGTVKWSEDSKVFGFITPNDGPPDVFAHFGEIRVEGFESLTEGRKVSIPTTISSSLSTRSTPDA